MQPRIWIRPLRIETVPGSTVALQDRVQLLLWHDRVVFVAVEGASGEQNEWWVVLVDAG